MNLPDDFASAQDWNDWNDTQFDDFDKELENAEHADAFVLYYLWKNGYKRSYFELKKELCTKWRNNGVGTGLLLN